MNNDTAEDFRHTGILTAQFDTITVLDLLNAKEPLVLHIPAYQRGYRWRKEHVETLISDLDEFYDSNRSSLSQGYPLQPIVLKQFIEGNEPKPFHFEVVDGQQRLTTICLMMDAWRGQWQESHPEWNLWSLKYDEVEDGIAWSLTEACKKNAQIIASRCSEETISNVINLIETGVVYFLYYLVGGDNAKPESPHEVFLRLNDGKIALTDSELIRALFWNRTVIEDKSYSPYQIAAEWEQLELLCRDPGFWSMVGRKNYKSFTRIDRLFEILLDTSDRAKRNPLAKVTFEKFNQAVRDDVGKGPVNSMLLLRKWQELVQLAWKLKSWYSDIELYHYICWLCRYANKSVESLWEESKQAQNEVIFKLGLQKQIYCETDGKGLALLHLASKPKDVWGKEYSEERLKKYYMEYSGMPYAYPGDSELGCKMPYGDKIEFDLIREPKKLEALMVLFNIESLNENHRNALKLLQRQDVSIASDRFERFPFELFDSERISTTWNIEHIAPQTKNTMDELDEQLVWALEMFEESRLDPEICKGSNRERIQQWLKQQYRDHRPNFEEVVKKYKLGYKPEETEFTGNESISFDEIYKGHETTDIDVNWHDRIGNLTLLDKKTNILNQNSIFPKKRRIIREVLMARDAIGEKQEHRFVPACTANVFMKYYTALSVSNSKWLKTDVMDYEADMRHIFSKVASQMLAEVSK